MKTEQIIWYLVISFAIIAIFRLLFLLRIVLPKNKHKQLISQYLPFVEYLFWMIYLILSISYFVNRNGIIHSIWLVASLLILILLFSYFALRDIVAAVIFKSSRDFKINDSIKFEGYAGKINAFHRRNLELITENEERIYLPYRKIIQGVVIKLNPTEMIQSYSFRLKTHAKVSSLEMQKTLRFEILNLPWSSVKNEPKIKLINEEDEFMEFELSVYSMNKEYFNIIENTIKKKYGK